MENNEKYIIKLDDYIIYLKEVEKSWNTIKKYKRDIIYFLGFLGEKELNKDIVLLYKGELIKKYASSSVNSMLAAINNFFVWIDKPQLKVKQLKIQRKIFCNAEKELTQKEYERLIIAAEENGNTKLSLLIQTVCSTGIRVSELEFITIQSVYTRRANVTCKGKLRTVFLSKKLCKVLLRYIREQNIKAGVVFRTKTGKALDRSNIWRMMKKLCKDAKVNPDKVFPHNLRHLFARTYYKIEKDISRLADILGHSNINTTRIYIIESGHMHEKQIGRMKLMVSRV